MNQVKVYAMFKIGLLVSIASFFFFPKFFLLSIVGLIVLFYIHEFYSD